LLEMLEACSAVDDFWADLLCLFWLQPI